MDVNILVSGAGGGGSNNLIRGLRKNEYEGDIVGTNVNKYYLAKSLADVNYLIPRGDEDGYFDSINDIIVDEDVDLIIPNSGTEVRAISENPDEVEANVFLPTEENVRLCQDKFELTEKLESDGVNVPETEVVNSLDEIPRIFEDIEGDMLWCRLREGSGSKGATKVKTPEQARSWIEYWEEMRGVDRGEFTLCEYLPGSDYAFQSVWQNGDLVISKTLERLSYYGGENRASGQSSSPQIGKLLYEEEVQEVCEDAVRSVDEDATGMYCIDLKEDEDGKPYVTEINIGRFFMVSNSFNEVGEHNMCEIYIKLAMGEEVHVENKRRDIGDETTYLVREVDTEPLLITEPELDERYLRKYK